MVCPSGLSRKVCMLEGAWGVAWVAGPGADMSLLAAHLYEATLEHIRDTTFEHYTTMLFREKLSKRM